LSMMIGRPGAVLLTCGQKESAPAQGGEHAPVPEDKPPQGKHRPHRRGHEHHGRQGDIAEKGKRVVRMVTNHLPPLNRSPRLASVRKRTLRETAA